VTWSMGARESTDHTTCAKDGGPADAWTQNGATEAAPFSQQPGAPRRNSRPQVIDIHGAPRWNRTNNLLIKSPDHEPTEPHSEDLRPRESEPGDDGELS